MQDIGNVVIVDDNPNNLEVLGEILRQSGYKVRPALNGALALRAIFAQPPDLVLLDIRMPDMDGYETCRALKAHPATADLPVIFISALNAIEDKLEAFQAGGVDYLIKPFQPEEVLARVRTHIDLARTRRSLAESNARLHALMDDMVLTEKLRSLGALAAGMAHELNTPIGNAMLAASTIEESLAPLKTGDTALGEPWQSCYDCSRMVMRSLERASQLIGTMKEMTVDRDSERRRTIQLNRTLREFTEAMAIVFRKTPYTITCDIPPDVELETYPGPLEQVLSNLVQNAVIHGFDGRPEGMVRIVATPRGDDGLTLSIHDNGKGIPAKNLPRIFEPFFTTRLGQGGSGLGLYIAYNLTRGVLGGRIHVDSTSDGTTFSLFLPWIAPEHAA